MPTTWSGRLHTAPGRFNPATARRAGACGRAGGAARPAAATRRSSASKPDCDRHGAPLARGDPRRLDDVEQVQIVRAAGERRAVLAQAGHELAQAVAPQPRRIERVVRLPEGRAVAPQLVAGRIPVVAEQVGRALGAVDLERGPAVALDRLARDDARRARRPRAAGSRAARRGRARRAARRRPPAAARRCSPRSGSPSTGPSSAVRLLRL